MKSQSHMPFCALMKCAGPSTVAPIIKTETPMHARTDTSEQQTATWPDDIYTVLQRYDVRQVPYVPDAGHSKLIERVLASDTMRGIPLTTEEEGVALVAGAWAGGQRCALLMQSSGVGNCINMFSLVQLFRLPFFTLVTMRGEWGEFNHWQVPMGSTTQAVFELSGIKVMRANSPAEVREVVEAGAAQAYNACTPTAVLLSQRLIGAKVFVK
jgi:sulfopyruvate decarboxylase alpha subunit